MRYLVLVVVTAVSIAVLTLTIGAQTDNRLEYARDIAGRVGRILGAAAVCRDINPVRIKGMRDRLQTVLGVATTSPADFNTLKQVYDRNVGEGQRAVTGGQQDCAAVDRDLADLEDAVRTPTQTAAAPRTAAPVPVRTGPGTAVVPTPVATRPNAPTTVAPAVSSPRPVVEANIAPDPAQGIGGDEIRFGIAAPFSGATRELGQQMKLGIEVAFNEANAHGGVNGRTLRLMPADDGYEPTRTLDAMKELYEQDKVFGVIGNVGTPTAQVALPYALERHMLFYGAFTGAPQLRHDPPDRYVFNYRASYAEETYAVMRYLMRTRKLRPDQIAVLAQQDGYGDAGFAGVTKALRTLRAGSDATIMRMGYKRNTVDVDDAVNQLRAKKGNIKAVVMVAAYRAAAKFIEKTRDAYPSLIYTNVSFVGSSSLAEELTLLGPRYAEGVIVTQVVPPIDGYASVVLDYKNALSSYSPAGSAERPDFVSFEAYLSAKLLVEGLRRSGPDLDTEKVVDALENLRDVDIGIGVPMGFSRTEHQALHKVWGTQLDATGKFQSLDLD